MGARARRRMSCVRMSAASLCLCALQVGDVIGTMDESYIWQMFAHTNEVIVAASAQPSYIGGANVSVCKRS